MYLLAMALVCVIMTRVLARLFLKGAEPFLKRKKAKNVAVPFIQYYGGGRRFKFKKVNIVIQCDVLLS